MINTHKTKQQGMVIIVALFIVGLVAALAYVMMARLERDIYRTQLINRRVQGDFYAQASVFWAIDQLRNNWIQQKNNHVIDPSPIKSPDNEVNGYHIRSVIYDMQSRFNINNLTNPEAQGDFIHLLQLLRPELRLNQCIKLTNAIVDWITPGDAATKNEYNDFYLNQPQPYRAAKKIIVSIEELKLIKGMTDKIFLTLKPYLYALPVTTPINVQTADLPVLTTLSKSMNYESAKALAALRVRKPFVSLDEFMNLDLIKNHQVAREKVTVVSSYFLVETTVSRDDQHVMLYTLLERNNRDGNTNVRIIWQSK